MTVAAMSRRYWAREADPRQPGVDALPGLHEVVAKPLPAASASSDYEEVSAADGSRIGGNRHVGPNGSSNEVQANFPWRA
ncbi:hypothetical protein [Dactylosporangium salmoneum]|uniref:hypothetical protein n=1 Tax=Dactylosporangium salmoneum TaxID=53361 RepID=UPI0031D9AFF0